MQLICRSHWREAASSADIGPVGRYISRKQLVHIFFQTDKMEGPKKQASLFSFFQKTPKSKPGPNGDTSKAESNKKAPMKTETESAWEVDIMNEISRFVDNNPIVRRVYLFGQD